MRRTFSTQLAALGVSPVVNDRLLNHAPAGVAARVYNKSDYLAEKRAALEAWDNRITQIVGANVIELGAAVAR